MVSRALYKSIFFTGLISSGFINSSFVVAEELPTVVVSATRSEQSDLTIRTNIAIIDQNEIKRSGATNIAELLRGHTGLVVSDTFGDGSKVNVGIRGFGETANANTLVLLDGRRLNNQDGANPDIYSISLADIERIEVIYGSAGVLYGDQAVGGVLNIVTKDPTKQEVNVDVNYGSYQHVDLKVHASDVMDNGLFYKFIAEDRQSDNYRDHNEKDFQQLSARLGLNYAKGSVYGEFQYIQDNLDTAGALFQTDIDVDRQQSLATFQNDFTNTKTNVGRLVINHELVNNWSLEAEVTARHSDGVFRLSSVTAAETQDAYQSREISEFMPRLIGALPFNNSEMLITFGADLIESDYFLSSRFGDQSNKQDVSGIYVQGVVPVMDDMDIIVGARYSEVENYLQDGYSYPSGQSVKDDVTVKEIGLLYRLSNNLNLNFRYDENFRFAKVDEFMMSALPPTYSPIILKTQMGDSFEMSMDLALNNLFVKAALFQLDLQNELAFDPVNGANINIDSTSRRGIKLDAEYQLNNDVDIGGSISYLDAEIESGIFANKAIPLVADKQARFYANYSVTEQAGLFAEVMYTGERVFSGDFSNILQSMPAYKVVNVGSHFTSENVTYKLRINNLLNEEYSEFGALWTDYASTTLGTFYPSPERNIMAGVNIKF